MKRHWLLLFMAMKVTAEVIVAFSVEVASNATVAVLNETAIAQMVLFDPLTNTTVQLEPLSAPAVTESIVGVLPSLQCANTSFYYGAGGECLECQKCPYVTVQTCSASANSVCDAACPAGARLWHGLCTLCAPGSYAGGSLCYACPVDTYALEAGLSVCASCPDGFASNGGASACVQVCLFSELFLKQ